jgi:transposase
MSGMNTTPRPRYPSDVSDDEWAFLAPDLTLMREDAPQRTRPLRELFNGLRYIARPGLQWRFMPTDLPPWQAAAEQGIALEVVKLPDVKRGFVLLPRRWVVERDVGWMSRFRRLARDQERLAEVLKGVHLIALTMLMWKKVLPMLHGL